MYVFDKKGQIETIHFSFNSINELCEYLNEADTSRSFAREDLKSMTPDSGWYGTPSLEAALDIAKHGQRDKYQSFLNIRNELDRYVKENVSRAKQFNDYIGFVPDVKAYLEGNPLSMINRKNTARKQIDIYFNVAISSGTSVNKVYNRGVIVLSLIELLEKRGFSVGLNIFDLSRSGNQILYAVFNLKKTGERSNPYKLFFPLCNSSWERRIVFRLTEVAPDISSSWTYGYGSPCDDYTIRKVLNLKDNDIVIPEPVEMGITGNDIVTDTNIVFDYIKSYTHDKVQLDHIKRLKH